MSAPVRLFIFGLGYSAARFALSMRGKADWIGGTVRSLDDAIALSAQGIRTFLFDGGSAGIGVAEAARQATHVLTSVPPGASDPVLACHRASIAAADRLQWIGYLSTVGVYGDANGGWINETTPPRPASARSIARLEAERAWQVLGEERRVPVAVFRIAGIYGPGRNALVNLADGTAHRVVKLGQVFNRIHVADIGAALVAASEKKLAGIFNLADDEPAPPQDVVAYAAALMGVGPPVEVPFAQAQLSPMAQSFYGENRRVRNGRLKSELGVALGYPTYREGLTALWREKTWRGDGGPA